MMDIQKLAWSIQPSFMLNDALAGLDLWLNFLQRLPSRIPRA